jgi:hypothetical protein
MSATSSSLLASEAAAAKGRWRSTLASSMRSLGSRGRRAWSRSVCVIDLSIAACAISLMADGQASSRRSVAASSRSLPGHPGNC